MKGLALSPGMRNRIAKGYYAFPPEEWDPVSQSSKRTNTDTQLSLATPSLISMPRAIRCTVPDSERRALTASFEPQLTRSSGSNQEHCTYDTKRISQADSPRLSLSSLRSSCVVVLI